MEAATLFNGLLGVKAHNQAMEGVADNLANQNTTGYKHHRSNFEDLFSEKLSYGSPAAVPTLSQTGGGAQVFHQNMMIQGALRYTEQATDLGIDGAGFFMVSDPVMDQELYTRNGAFTVDREGYLVLPGGQRLMGYGVDDQGEVVVGNLEEIQLPLTEGIQQATSEVGLVINLDAEEADEFAQATAIDPADGDTYNHAVTSQVYDEQGRAHTVVTFYQKLDSYSGLAPADSQSVWKAATFEADEDGNVTANPAAPDNEFFLHFDTEGHLAGLSGPGTPSGAEVLVDGSNVATAGTAVSDRVGETFGYTGDGAAQSFLSTMAADVSGWGPADTLTLSDTSGALAAYAGLADGQALALAINADTGTTGVWADYDAGAGQLTLYSAAADPVSVAGAATTGNTLQEVIDAVNNGRAATGTISLDLTTWADGVDTLTVGGATYDYDTAGGGAEDFADLTELETLLTAAGYSVSREGGANSGYLFITAGSVGDEANADALGSTTAGAFAASGATLAGGMDATADTLVEASASAAAGGAALYLERTDVGAAATITVAGGSLGAGLGAPLDFGQTTEVQAASDGSAWAEEGGEVEMAFTFTGTDADGNPYTETRDITFDYLYGMDPLDPDAAYTGSTASAGAYDTFRLEQDGYPAGHLLGIRISEQGLVTGIYSNEEEVSLAAVALTDFVSPENLRREGETLWRHVEAAGPPVTGRAGDADLGLGEVHAGYLESSTVDVAQQMVNMINYQRAFQANSKSILTGDQVLQTALGLKR
jgi:flagellar hook protein FlgE